MRKVCLFLVAFLIGLPLRADDSAAAIGAGGIVVLKNEKRIAMAKEVLTIGLHKVHVDYEFRNDTADNVTTMVAFPIPAYQWSGDMMHSAQELGFDDFKLTIEGKPTTFTTEILARVNGKDVTQVLKANGIDVASFGHVDDKTSDFQKLSPAQIAALQAAGIIDTNIGQPGTGTQDNPTYIYPSWSVEKKYYWTQTFPAHSTVHIAHDYSPVNGYTLVNQSDFIALAAPPVPGADPLTDTMPALLRSVCVDESLRKQLINLPFNPNNGTYRGMFFVDFILTTANTWKQPINDFTLLVERPTARDDPKFISFCWPSSVTKVSANEFKATATNLVPTSELRIGFFAQ